MCQVSKAFTDQQGAVEQKTRKKARRACSIPDEVGKRIPGGQRPVEVKRSNGLFHFLESRWYKDTLNSWWHGDLPIV